MKESYSKATVKSIEKYLQLGLNVYLVGAHGIGKTTMVEQACRNLGWKCKVFNAALLDPFVDITGIPHIEKVPVSDTSSAEQEEVTKEVMRLVRSADLDDADVIMFDEFARGRVDVVNAVMNIVDKKMINNEKLPRLKAVVAASNPAKDSSTGKAYNSSFVDDAILDRFDVFLSCDIHVKESYIAHKFKEYRDLRGYDYSDEALDALAHSIASWQHDMVFVDSAGKPRAEYVSPRRCEKLGKIYMDIPKKSTVQDVLGGSEVGVNILYDSMYRALLQIHSEVLTKDAMISYADMWYEDMKESSPDFMSLSTDIKSVHDKEREDNASAEDMLLVAFQRVCFLDADNGTDAAKKMYKGIMNLSNSETSTMSSQDKKILKEASYLIIEASAEISRKNKSE